MAGKAKTAREQALEQVVEHQGTVARWEAEKLTAEQELRSLQQRAGEEVLADESAASRLPKLMQELRDRADIAERALEAARPRLQAAQVAALLAEADEWDAEAGRRRKALERHVAKIDEHLAALRELDGVEYGLIVEDHEHIPAGARIVVQASKREHLETEVDRAELTAHVLREIAAGRDPSAELRAKSSVVDGSVLGLPVQDFYPASVWGPDAVLPAPAYVATLPADG